MKKIVLYLCVIVFVSFFASLTAPKIHAEGPWYILEAAECLFKAGTEKTLCLTAHANAVMNGAMTGIIEQVYPMESVTYPMGTDPQLPYLQELRRSSFLAHSDRILVTMFQNAPASSYLAFRDFGQELGFLPKTVYAQGPGVGFSGLAPLLPIWKIFRNIAYFFLAIIMLVIGFMVMFRKKIDPKTVVTVQNALPGIIVTLLLITFSYAIVGILIDIMYVIILIIYELFNANGLLPPLGNVAQAMYSSPQELYTTGALWVNIWNIPIRIEAIFGEVYTYMSVASIFASLGLAATGNFLLAAPIALIGGLPLIYYFLMAIAMIFLVIRLFIFFLNTYIQIIISLIFGPVQLLMGAIPGSNTFDSWFKNLVANIAVFPISVTMFMLAAAFGNLAATQQGGLWNPPLAFPLVNSIQAISSLLAMGVLFAIPTVAGSVKETLKSKPLFAAGTEGIAGQLGGPTQLLMQGYQFWSSRESMKQMGELIAELRKK